VNRWGGVTDGTLRVVPVPVLQLERARIDVAGVPAIDGLSFTTTEQHVLVVGAARALFEAAAGLRHVAHGQVRLLGTPAGAAARSALVAAVPLDPPLPPRWAVRTYVIWSARLAGCGRSRARVMADEALAELGITRSAGVKLAVAETPLRRMTLLAAALATGATVLLLEDPTLNLPDEQARNLARIAARALARRSSVIFAPRMSLASPLSTAAEEAVVVAGSGVAGQGAPAEIASRQTEFTLEVHGGTDAFVSAVVERGGRVSGRGPMLVVALGDALRVRDLLATATATGATVVAIRPLAQAFV
jgi:ABC-type multidrug transport system ATPase subunit